MATKKEKPEQDVFSKDALIASGIFDNRKDALAIAIDDGEKISVEEAAARLEKLMKRKVE